VEDQAPEWQGGHQPEVGRYELQSGRRPEVDQPKSELTLDPEELEALLTVLDKNLELFAGDRGWRGRRAARTLRASRSPVPLGRSGRRCRASLRAARPRRWPRCRRASALRRIRCASHTRCRRRPATGRRAEHAVQRLVAQMVEHGEGEPGVGEKQLWGAERGAGLHGATVGGTAASRIGPSG
jgi:hypothetical protein